MKSSNFANSSNKQDIEDNDFWEKLYSTLRPIVRKQVYSFRVSSWYGQEEDIIEDILQETARRLIERYKQSLKGEKTPIQAPENLACVVAKNYCKDMRRHDRHFNSLSEDTSLLVEHYNKLAQEYDQWTEAIIEDVYRTELFTFLACEIAAFPKKQRRALLIDLANHTSFEEQPTPLQKALLKRGIRLEEYQQPRYSNVKERTRHAALLHLAYKRMAQRIHSAHSSLVYRC